MAEGTDRVRVRHQHGATATRSPARRARGERVPAHDAAHRQRPAYDACLCVAGGCSLRRSQWWRVSAGAVRGVLDQARLRALTPIGYAAHGIDRTTRAPRYAAARGTDDRTSAS